MPAIATTDRLIGADPQAVAAVVRAIVRTQKALRSDALAAAAAGQKLFPPFEAGLITAIVARDLPFYTPEAFTRGMDAGGKLDWRLAKDGMTIELPAGSTEIRYGQATAP